MQRHSKKTHLFKQYNIYFMTLYASCTHNALSRNNRTTCLRIFIFILRDTSRGLSRIFRRNKPPGGRQVLRYAPVAGPEYATPVTLQTSRMPHSLYTDIFETLVHLCYFFMFIPCILVNTCLLYTNICTCKFILKLLRHVSVLMHHLQGVYNLC
jgi:hypothetical protein